MTIHPVQFGKLYFDDTLEALHDGAVGRGSHENLYHYIWPTWLARVEEETQGGFDALFQHTGADVYISSVHPETSLRKNTPEAIPLTVTVKRQDQVLGTFSETLQQQGLIASIRTMMGRILVQATLLANGNTAD